MSHLLSPSLLHSPITSSSSEVTVTWSRLLLHFFYPTHICLHFPSTVNCLARTPLRNRHCLSLLLPSVTTTDPPSPLLLTVTVFYRTVSTHFDFFCHRHRSVPPALSETRTPPTDHSPLLATVTATITLSSTRLSVRLRTTHHRSSPSPVTEIPSLCRPVIAHRGWVIGVIIYARRTSEPDLEALVWSSTRRISRALSYIRANHRLKSHIP